jgi:hypothetical protein
MLSNVMPHSMIRQLRRNVETLGWPIRRILAVNGVVVGLLRKVTFLPLH